MASIKGGYKRSLTMLTKKRKHSPRNAWPSARKKDKSEKKTYSNRMNA